MSSKHRTMSILVILAVLVLSGAAGAAIGMSQGSGQLVRSVVCFGALVLSGAVVAVVNRRVKRERG